MKIIFKSETGGVSILHPTPDALTVMSIEDIALKDVPTGLPFAIVEDDVIPIDRTLRNAWTVEETDLTDGIGADYGVGSENILLGFDEIGNPITVHYTKYQEMQSD